MIKNISIHSKRRWTNDFNPCLTQLSKTFIRYHITFFSLLFPMFFRSTFFCDYILFYSNTIAESLICFSFLEKKFNSTLLNNIILCTLSYHFIIIVCRDFLPDIFFKNLFFFFTSYVLVFDLNVCLCEHVGTEVTDSC